MEIDFEKLQGLVPAIIQDEATGEVLMLGFMNDTALEATLRTGRVTFDLSFAKMSSDPLGAMRVRGHVRELGLRQGD